MDSARRLTGIAGRWSATHPWTVIAAWVGCVVVLLLTGHLVGTVQLPNSQTASGQAGQAEQMMSRDFAERANEFVLFDSRSLQVGAPAYEAAIRDVLLDATVVRALLLPATMKLLGHRNWYLPHWLQWLPQTTRQHSTAAARQPPRQPLRQAKGRKAPRWLRPCRRGRSAIR